MNELGTNCAVILIATTSPRDARSSGICGTLQFFDPSAVSAIAVVQYDKDADCHE